MIDRHAALLFLRKVQREHPNDFYANEWLGLTLDEPAEKASYFRAALAVQPDALPANYNLGKSLYDQGRPSEALPYLERAVEIAPRDALAQGGLGLTLHALAQTDKAIDCFQRSVRFNPNMAWVRIDLGITLEEKGRLQEALEQFEEGVRIDPRRVNTQLNLASILREMSRPADAVEHGRAAVADDPKSIRAQILLGQLLLDMGRLDEATDRFSEAVTLAPTDSKAQEGLRTALFRLGRLQDVRSAWRKALDAGPPKHEAWFGYAELCLFLGNQDEYLRNRRELLVRFGGSADPSVCERVGKTCLLLPGTKEEIEAAATLTDRAIAARRKEKSAHPYSAFAKGLAKYRLGKYDDAIGLMRGEAAGASSLGPSPRIVTAMALYQKGQRDEARRTLAAAIVSYDWSASKADSHDPWLTHVLRREAEALILPKLPAFLEGKYQPADNDERLAFLGVCQFKDLRGAMAGLYAATFAADPKLAEDLKGAYRYRAACAAAVAGCGGGADGAALSETERARWRQQAREWLRLDLAEWTSRLNAAAPPVRATVQRTLAQWRDDPDLAGVREPAALTKLPSEERQEWHALWSDVAARLGSAPLAK